MTVEQMWGLTGRNHFDYSDLCDKFDDEDLSRYVVGVRQLFGRLAGNWDEAKNSEWIARFYLSLKLILSSQLMVSSLAYAEEQNL
jgi:hypothetical protein